MADIVDDANDAAEAALQRTIDEASRAGPVISPRGYCLFCGARSLPDGSPWPAAYRWCDAGCKEDWSRITGVR